MQKTIGLLGYVNKSEFVQNLAKVIDITGKKVLVIDSTIHEYYRYTLPFLDRTEKEIITNFDGIDFAIGFKSVEEVKEYLCKKTSEVEDYDYIIIDIDNPKGYDNFKNEPFTKYYFFIEHSLASMTRNEDLVRAVKDLSESKERIEFIKVLFKYYITRAGDRLFEGRLSEFNVTWTDEEYELTYMDQDKIADLESELSGFLDFSRHTRQYMDLVTDIAAEIIGDITANELRKMVKSYSRRRG